MTMPLPTQSFGWYLKSVRKARRMSLKQLCTISGVSQGAICDVEKGRRVPGREITNKLAKALSLDLAEVYSRSGRLPDDVTNYMIQHPNAGALLQKLVEFNFSDRSLAQIIIYLCKLYDMAKERKMKQQAQQGNSKNNKHVEEKDKHEEQVDNTTPSVSNVINELQQEQESEDDNSDDNDSDDENEENDDNESEEDDFNDESEDSDEDDDSD